MISRHCALILCCLIPAPPPAAGDEPPPRQLSLLSCGLSAAERTSVSAMLAESNLTWKSHQLSTLTRLLAAAGRFDRALELVESAEAPDRVIAPALAEIATGAIRAGDDALADRVAGRLSAMTAWTAPAALLEVVEALGDAGRSEKAVALFETLGDPEVRAGALISRARSAPAGSTQAGAWLRQALKAARQIRPKVGAHVEIDGVGEYLADYSQRYSVLVEIAGAFAERGLIDSARGVVAVIGGTEGGHDDLWQARALIAVSEAPGAAGPRLKRLAEAVEAADSAFEMTVGDTREKVETLTSIARRFAAMGKPKRAGEALALAGSAADKLERTGDAEVRASVGVETLALIAAAHADLGRNEQALAILAAARGWVDALAVPEPVPSPSSTWDPVSSARHTRVKALATIAAGREQAGRAAPGPEVDAGLIAEIAAISDPSWRESAWLSVVSAYLGVERPERLIEILRAGDARAPGQLRARTALVESLMAADRLDDAASIASELPSSHGKVELLAKLADRLERAGGEGEAEQLITAALGIAAAAEEPAERDRLLVALARAISENQSPLLTRRATPEQRQVLTARLGCR